MSPSKTAQWKVEGLGGFDDLKLHKDVEIPKLGDHDVLVKMSAASLNYRDLIITKGKYPFAMNLPVVPASDGAGTVESVGPRVTEFKAGDKVCTLFNQGHQAGELNLKTAQTGLGGAIDGALREYGIFEETGLVAMPQSLSFEEGATLPCAALTAWNALYGNKPLKQGDWVLTQGTGGVSIFAVQFAVAAGATVIATTSSAEKGKKLKELGAHHVINYKEDENWGETAKKLTPGGEGVGHIIEVGGPATVEQSLAAVKFGGTISVIGKLTISPSMPFADSPQGFLGGGKGNASPLDALMKICTIRGILVGSKAQFEDMNAAIEVNKIKPVVDSKVFKFADTKEAYQYQWDQKHFGKVVISIP